MAIEIEITLLINTTYRPPPFKKISFLYKIIVSFAIVRGAQYIKKKPLFLKKNNCVCLIKNGFRDYEVYSEKREYFISRNIYPNFTKCNIVYYALT